MTGGMSNQSERTLHLNTGWRERASMALDSKASGHWERGWMRSFWHLLNHSEDLSGPQAERPSESLKKADPRGLGLPHQWGSQGSQVSGEPGDGSGREPGMPSTGPHTGPVPGSLEGAVHQTAWPHPQGLDLTSLRRDLRLCPSREFSGQAAAGPGVTRAGPQTGWPLPPLSRRLSSCPPSSYVPLLSLGTPRYFCPDFKAPSVNAWKRWEEMGAFQRCLWACGLPVIDSIPRDPSPKPAQR